MAVAVPARPRSRRRFRILPLALLLLALPAGAWGLAKIGVIPTERWAAKSPKADRVVTAFGLGSPKKATVLPVAPVVPLPAVTPARHYNQPLEMTASPAPKPQRRDNPARVARILSTMDAPEVARLFVGMPDAEVAPLLLAMSERMAGEILTALPTRRAIALTRYLRRYERRE